MNKNKNIKKARKDYNITNEQKQKIKHYQKQYRENETDEQKQKMKDYQKEYRKNMTDKKKKYIKLVMNKNKNIEKT